jgi:hypothetical protein
MQVMRWISAGALLRSPCLEAAQWDARCRLGGSKDDREKGGDVRSGEAKRSLTLLTLGSVGSVLAQS